MDDQKLSKKDLKAIKKLQELEQTNYEKRQNLIKWVVISVASILFLAFFSYIIFFSKQQAKQVEKPLSSAGWVRGNENAKNVLVEFSDIQCPACRANEPFVIQALKDFDGKLKFIYKHFPLTTVHKYAMPGSLALEAAGKQGKFWEMHDLLFEKQPEWSIVTDIQPTFEGYAAELELDVEQFKKDMQDASLQQKVNDQLNEGITAGVNSTPTFYLNNEKLEPVSSYTEFKQQIESKLK